MTLIIIEIKTGKKHKREIKENISISYDVEGKYLVVRSYWDNKILHKYDVSKYGSIYYYVK